MPPHPPPVTSELLREQIELRLLAVRDGRKSSTQGKSELAVLLYEAHRSEACRSWGFKALGKFAAERLAMNPATFAKYKTAGKVLYDSQRGLYDEMLTAVVHGRARPELPPVSELAAMPSLEKQVSGVGRGLLQLLDSGAALGKVKALAQMDSYGSADAEGRRLLSALDGFVQDAKRAKAVLTELGKGDHFVPDEHLQRRLHNVQEVCGEVLRALEALRPG